MRVSVADFVTPPNVAERVTLWGDETAKWITANVVELVPFLTSMLAGTEAALGLELCKVTIAPEGGALPDNVMVPVIPTFDPPTARLVDRLIPDKPAG